jgi:hypothetical protein
MPVKRINRDANGASAWSGTAPGFAVDSDTNQLEVNVDGTKRQVAVCGYGRILTATTSLVAADSGGVFYLNASTEFVTTLPAPFLGARYEFVVHTAPSGADYTVFTASGANVMVGSIHSSTGGNADSEQSGGDTLSFVGGQSVKGDRAIITSDGTSWYVTAFCDADAGITITTAA